MGRAKTPKTPVGAKRPRTSIAPKDEGAIGIALEDQEKVFEEFRQVGMADKKAEGTGLSELHGGRICVKSELGVGSTFTFTIPVRHGERD